ncbi:MAG: ribokinase [Chthonomonadales bacterium]
MNHDSPAIIVIGSSNTDLVVHTEHIPRPGETILGHKFVITNGGKGANQAVAAAKLGGSVGFVARIGNDDFGNNALAGIKSAGVNTDNVVRDAELPSGVALICISAEGENSIVVAQGSNGLLSPNDIDRAMLTIKNCKVVVTQFETPFETVAYLVKMSNSLGKNVIVNPAPAQQLPDGFLHGVYVITPNEKEAAGLLGWDTTADYDPDIIATNLLKLGVKNVVITLGAGGVFAATADGMHKHFAGHKVIVTDTTGAGDCFTGALAVGISQGIDFFEAVEFANAAAALSTTKFGAQSGMPTKLEVTNFLAN